MVTGSSAPYEIVKSASVCAATGTVLEPGDRIVAVLAEHEPGEPLQRLEFTRAAWDNGARPEAPLRMFGHWRTRVPEPGGKDKGAQFIDNDDLLDLFEQLGEVDEGETPDARRQAFRYLLALVLIRKKQLLYEGGVPVDAKAGTAGVLRVRPKGVPLPPEGPELMEVVDPGLDPETLAAATEQLGEIMDLGPTGSGS